MQLLLDSYRCRLKTLRTLLARTTEALEKSRQDQEQMMEELRESLARRESLRRKDFDAMMGSICTHRQDQERQVSRMVSRFLRQRQATVQELRRLLGDGTGLRLDECRALTERVIGEHESFERGIGGALFNLHLEEEELSAGLKEVLAKGEGARRRPLKALARTFLTRQSLAKSELGGFLEELTALRGEFVARWRGVLAAGAPLAQEA